MKCGFLLNIVVRESPSIFQLLASKNETLLVWRNSFFVLNLGFDIFNGVTGFNFKSNGFSSKCLDKNLHASTKTENQMKCGFFLNVVVGQGPSIFQLLSSKNKTLLVWRNSFFVLDLSFDILNGVTGFNFKSDSFSCEGLDKNLHFVFLVGLFVEIAL